MLKCSRCGRLCGKGELTEADLLCKRCKDDADAIHAMGEEEVAQQCTIDIDIEFSHEFIDYGAELTQSAHDVDLCIPRRCTVWMHNVAWILGFKLPKWSCLYQTLRVSNAKMEIVDIDDDNISVTFIGKVDDDR